MRRLIACATLSSGLLLLGACAATTSAARPQAFPSSRPVANTPAETEAVAPPAEAVPPSVAVVPASAALLQTAFDLIGTPYRFGGDTPEGGFDCSGFVKYVLRQHAMEIPRTVAEQWQAGRAVAQDDVRAGDLVFFTTTGPGATHVGLVVTTGARWEFVHAPADGASVRVERFDMGYWQQRWLGARRVF